MRVVTDEDAEDHDYIWEGDIGTCQQEAPLSESETALEDQSLGY